MPLEVGAQASKTAFRDGGLLLMVEGCEECHRSTISFGLSVMVVRHTAGRTRRDMKLQKGKAEPKGFENGSEGNDESSGETDDDVFLIRKVRKGVD